MVRWWLAIFSLALFWSSSAHARTFEQELKGAEQVKHLARIIGPFLQGCGAGTGLRAIQCRAIRSRMQHRIRRGTYWSTASAVQVGAYDNTRLNFPVSVVGCLTCTGPAKLDRELFGKSKWYVTTGRPRSFKVKGGKPEFGGLELKKIVQPVGPSQVETWMNSKLPNLKVQMIYKVDGTKWPRNVGTGLVVKMVGYRLYNQCSGKVLVSEPPSTRPGPVFKSPSCGVKRVVVRRVEPRRPSIPARLSPRDIQTGMNRIGALVQDCYNQYQIPGLAQAVITVAGATGKVTSVKILGQFAGTPTTGKCVQEAVMKARFRTFTSAKMTFQYRWHLR